MEKSHHSLAYNELISPLLMLALVIDYSRDAECTRELLRCHTMPTECSEAPVCVFSVSLCVVSTGVCAQNVSLCSTQTLK